MCRVSNRLSITLSTVLLLAALGLPFQQVAYANDQEQSQILKTHVAQSDDKENQSAGDQDNKASNSNDASDEEDPNFTTVIKAASSASESINKDSQSVPYTVTIALGLAAAALVLIVFKAKA